MVIEILLIISVVLQIVAAIVAIGLIRRTKYNLSWMLFTVALTCMAFMRLAEYVQITSLKTILRLPPEFFVWMGVVTSLCVALGMLLVKRIFNYIASTENQRRISERRILNTVLRTEEKERLRFSKDLHDGLGPLLSSAKMSVSALAADKTDERSREILRNASYVIDEAIRSLREISVNLSPHILKDFGLARAVSNFIGRLPHSGMRIHFSTNLHAERFDADIEVILYRVICELINNSIKHSGAAERCKAQRKAEDGTERHHGPQVFQQYTRCNFQDKRPQNKSGRQSYDPPYNPLHKFHCLLVLQRSQ